ncbi:hypothetical protein SAMN02927921_03447 [Sinomicrobium oceani]|uniref:Uncharacterized protein n=2 Tax=Sinomicrobium oceani TaxID=1150368 RepID=A0A1K1RF32_9FLAO|nr:hypothetical protein SAMN02927921_03447 [Sinomicrobium oceani]
MSILPYYMIDFSGSACMFEIRVNDYPVITQDLDGQVSSMIPINYAILKDGIQTISATVLPYSGTETLHPKASLRFKVMLFDVTSDFMFKEQFSEYQTQDVGDKVLPVLKEAGTFSAQIPYTLDAWQNGLDLKDEKDLGQKLISAYQKIEELIATKKYDLFREKISKREGNMALSMYLSEEESQSRISGLVSDFESGFEVVPVTTEGAVLQIYGNGKVAALKKADGRSGLMLYNKETKEELMLDLTFYIPKGKTEFEII